jgi:imidazoleglycerol phosphate synthase glutamine amidotransferase subunit HisH
MLDKIEIIKRGSVRRSKIYYLRGRVGRKALKAGDTKSIYLTDEVVVPTEGEGEEQAMPLEEEALEEEIVEEVVEEVEVTEEPTEETKEE